MLWSCIHKILSNKIGNRLTEYAEKNDWWLPKYGFRTNRGTIGNIHLLKQIIEKAYDYNIQTYCL